MQLPDLPRLHQTLRHWAAVRPGHVAMKTPTDALTYEQLLEAVESAGQALQCSGVSAGDVVAFQLPNWMDAFVLYHAILSIDAIALSLLPALRDHELSYMVRESHAHMFITLAAWRGHDHAAMALRVCGTHVRVSILREPHETGPLLRDWGQGQAAHERIDSEAPVSRGGPLGSPNAVCSMIFTSGTSGPPKAVLYSHQCLAFEGREMARADCIEADDVLFVPSSIGHVSGLSFGIYMPMHVGATVCLLPEWNARLGVAFIGLARCTWTAGATPFLQGIVAEAAAQSGALVGLRVFRCGGASVPAGLIKRARSLGIDAYRSYGMSEHPTISGRAGQPEAVCIHTDGALHPLVEVRIVDPENPALLLDLDTEGEIIVRGPDTSHGYLSAADTETSRFDGWLLTGDLGTLSVGRVLTVTGRKKDVIIRKGEKVSAKEIEDLLTDHPSIADVAVIGVTDDERGEMAVCVAVAKADTCPSLTSICSYLRDHGVAAFKLPERLVLVDQLPYNSGGKVLKATLKSMVTGGATALSTLLD